MPDQNSGPFFCLEDDWPRNCRPSPGEVFSMPFSPEPGMVCKAGIVDENGIKKLVLSLNSAQQVEIRAMTAGSAAADPSSNTIVMTTDVFSATGWNTSLGVFSPAPTEFPVPWFANWHETDRYPRRIIYEGVSGLINGNVSSGTVIGKTPFPLSFTADQQLKIAVEYSDSTESQPRFMHPIEFFSLLFWKNECDPLYNASPLSYAHPLLQKLMTSRENGDSGTYRDFDWLGLRPPLRTYKRVEWEAKRELGCYGTQWENTRALKYNGRYLLQNPFIFRKIFNDQCPAGEPHDAWCGHSKCNILSAEVSFRAGFKVPVSKRPSQPFWGYMGPIDLLGIWNGSMETANASYSFACNSDTNDRKEVKVQRNSQLQRYVDDTSLTASGETDTYKTKNTAYGRQRYVHAGNLQEINDEISRKGKVIIHHAVRNIAENTDTADDGTVKITRTHQFHQVVISEMKGIDDTGIHANIIDQHCTNNVPREVNAAGSRTNPYGRCLNKNTRIFIELIPGGDPTEEWGILDLNSVEKETPSA